MKLNDYLLERIDRLKTEEHKINTALDELDKRRLRSQYGAEAKTIHLKTGDPACSLDKIASTQTTKGKETFRH